jgi:very-short-patch-repair endonuclease
MDESDNHNPRPVDDAQIRDRAIRLFTFLRELTELRTKMIRTSDKYETVLWFNEIPRAKECYCITWQPVDDEEQSEIWVEIKKPILKEPPKVPETLEPWLDTQEVADSSHESPSLRERIIVNMIGEREEGDVAELPTVFQELDESPEIKSLWERYVEEEWLPWAKDDRRLQAVQKAYTDLFSIYQKQQRLGEAYEAVVGFGYLTWRTPSGHEVKRHILTAQTSITFDASRGVIALVPAGEGAKLTLEQDMLEPGERLDTAEQNVIDDQIAEIGDALWGGVGMQTILEGWIHALSPRGQYCNTLNPPNGAVGSAPVIHLATAVILRKRTERSLLRVYEEIIEELQSGQTVPVGVRRLVTIMDDASVPLDGDVIKDSSDGGVSPESTELYFPLPANEAQRSIVRKLSTRQGVLVQGPPGTGKSQTIANLVCHLLATGQRVLVTSHTPRALKVLRNKFPPEIAALCVALLGDDRTALQYLEDSVQGITDRHNTWNSEINRQHIAELQNQLDETRRAEASNLNELRVIREAETYIHPLRFDTYEGTVQVIANRLREEEAHYSWLPVRPIETDEPPLSDTEATELIQLLRDIHAIRKDDLTQATVDPESMISPNDFAVLVKDEDEARIRYEAAEEHRNHPEYAVMTSIPRIRQKALIDGFSDLLISYNAVAKHIQPWTDEAATQIMADQCRAWRELLNITREHLESIGDRARNAGGRQISGLDGRNRNDVKNHAVALLQHLEGGGKLGFWRFRPDAVKEGIYLIKDVRVDGALCDTQQPLRYLLEWIEIADHLDVLRECWAPHTKVPSSSFAAQVAGYEDLCEPLEKSLELHEKVASLKWRLAAPPRMTEPTWHDIRQLKSFQVAMESVSLDDALAEARHSIDAIETGLHDAISQGNVHSAVKQAQEAVRARDTLQYEKAHHTLCNLKKLRDRVTHRDALLHRLEATAPELAFEVRLSYADRVWDDHMSRFRAAWNWARADCWLGRLNDPQTGERLLHDLEHNRSRIQEIIRDLAAANAWEHCFARLTEHERQHLMAWKDATRRIGKGTGKHAAMHRRSARDHMEQCRSAIPAWIMPIYRVAETMCPGTDSFDVVIIDEASQSGPEALFLQYLATKIIVVGDDKQISPDSIGIDREGANLLRQRRIPDIPHNDALGVDSSFFNQAEIRYGGRIRLREHFRCMPEIIQFSNDLCYRSEPLIPLRQYGADRLTPVIVARHVPEGYIEGDRSKINPPEAQAIVDRIKQCIKNPIYDGKSMGVISLLSHYQARYIETLLLEELGPEEMEQRNLVCGDAYAFQGDERDVMFLSMVSAPTEGRRIGTLASQRDERRFNVAASRAKDQMWLFHTATLNDLSPNCLRYKLLQYCQNPHVETTEVGGLDVEELKTVAQTSDRDRDSSPSPFDSWFEVDVFLRIVGSGYRVIPQFDVLGYRIDLVVEGMRGRLAVECDGDAWHGPENYAEDMGRQRDLERCGWTFWRVRGSTFYRDPNAALEGLWGTLDRLGIYPAGHNMEEVLVDTRAQGSQP